MKKEEILRVISEAVEQEVTEDSKIADLGLDSLDTVEMMLEIEEKFNITIPDNDFEKFVTVGDIVKYLEEKSLL